MVVLTRDEIDSAGLVVNAVDAGRRATTYDATVGRIILEGAEFDGDKFRLPPRGIVWVVSAETFRLPETVTGLATLRTTWTHDGVLSLNVGIVDPGWDGPLSAAVVNFSNSDFTIERGDTFLRILFQSHQQSACSPETKSMDQYVRETVAKSRAYSRTFLHMERLVSEVSERVFGLPRVAYILAVVALILAVLSVFAPITWSVWGDKSALEARLTALEVKLDSGGLLPAPAQSE